ncbi:DUF1479-domain-containing protein [Meredithblackwellia eburnea MCA 4105]
MSLISSRLALCPPRALPGGLVRLHLSRNFATEAPNIKIEGDISSTFTTFSGRKPEPLPPRFLDLKKNITAGFEQELQKSWDVLVEKLKVKTEEVATKREKMIPIVNFSDIKAGTVPASTVAQIRQTGVAVARGVVPRAEAEAMLASLREYVAGGRLRGFPSDQEKKVVYESYWSPAQIKARSHPNMLSAQAFMNNLYHTSSATELVDLQTPLTYCDRLQIRPPGDTRFALSPHVDGGGVERWEDESYRETYREIFRGNWPSYDPWDLRGRAVAKMDLYNGPGACSVLRTFQSWLGLTTHSPGEGTLVVHPILRETTAYWMLRPFFRPTVKGSLNGWKLDLTEEDGTVLLHGANPGTAQEHTPAHHPHLRLEETMVPYPTVEPGDTVYWSADTIHGTEMSNSGSQDAVVLYIPSVPLTEMNVKYVKRQREAFNLGLPPPDFPGGAGESTFVDRGGKENISGKAGLQAMGFVPFDIVRSVGGSAKSEEMRIEANEILELK